MEGREDRGISKEIAEERGSGGKCDSWMDELFS